jgi:hypothetical protein
MNPPDTITTGSSRTRSRRSARNRRRIYADFRELLELEPAGRRLTFTLSPAQSLAAEARQPELQQGALPFRELHSDPSWTGSPAAESSTAAAPDVLDPSFKTPAEAPVLLVVDQRMTMFYGSRRSMKSVIAAKAAALFAWRMLAQHKPVGALIFNDQKIVQLRPHCSRLRVILILHALLNQNHALLPNAGIRSNLPMLNEALRRTEQVAQENSLVFLITDASGQDEETSRLASGISRNKRLLAGLVYDPRQTQARARAAGSFIAGDRNESQTGDRHSRERLHGTFGRQQPIGRRFFPDEVPIIPLNTRDDVADQMRRSLRRLFLSPSLGMSLSELHNARLEKERARASGPVPTTNWSHPANVQNTPPAQPWQL